MTDKFDKLQAFHARSDNPEKDWTEDFSHENGNYFCICHRCKSQFIGHKRRITCRECYREFGTRTRTPAAPQTGYSWTNSAPHGAPETIAKQLRNMTGFAGVGGFRNLAVIRKAADALELSDARIAALQDERDEDANQLNSARHTVDVLTARIAELKGESDIVAVMNLQSRTMVLQDELADALNQLATAHNQALEDADYLASLMKDAAQKLREACDAHALLSQYDKVSQMEATADELDAVIEALKTPEGDV